MRPTDSPPIGHRHLVLGGARSGKSSFAERRALDLPGGRATYVATASARDEEMQRRIDHHQEARDSTAWTLVEEELDLARVVASAAPDATLLIDCLTLWLSNCLHAQVWDDERARFLDALSTGHANIIMVSNEVGLGVVPLGELTRQFVDESGRLHQEVAERCDEVTLLVAGLPHRLKPQS